jgi:hypothetical protein
MFDEIYCFNCTWIVLMRLPDFVEPGGFLSLFMLIAWYENQTVE